MRKLSLLALIAALSFSAASPVLAGGDPAKKEAKKAAKKEAKKAANTGDAAPAPDAPATDAPAAAPVE